jgi:hypothetical protein
MAHSTLRFGETFDIVHCPGSGEGAVSIVNIARSLGDFLETRSLVPFASAGCG